MSSAAFPSVIAAVVSTAQQALPDVRAIRGRNIDDQPGDVVMVGVSEVDSDWSPAGSFQQSMQTFGGAREEVGTVSGLVLSWNGNADQDSACSTAFSHLAALEAAVRADPTLGLTGYSYVVAEMQTGDVQESQTTDGATTALAFTISYKIRI